MSINLYLCGRKVFSIPDGSKTSDIEVKLQNSLGVHASEVYFVQNGRNIESHSTLSPLFNVYAEFRQFGGKGGFGSMLRAIGAQIEKTTNRESCRDLSGRRLRHINEEKRLKTWLDSQKNRDKDNEDKQKKKIEKLQAKPKHEFKDDAYEQTRSELTQSIAESVEEGLKKAAATNDLRVGTKRPAEVRNGNGKNNKKRKGALWLDDIGSSSDESDKESSST